MKLNLIIYKGVNMKKVDYNLAIGLIKNTNLSQLFTFVTDDGFDAIALIQSNTGEIFYCIVPPYTK